MQDALSFGFGRRQVSGWTSQESAWLIESTAATVAERMCALPPQEAEQWMRLAEVEVSPEIEQRLLGHEVLVLVPRVRYPAFCESPPSTPLLDLRPELEEEPSVVEEALNWIEVEVRTANGDPAADLDYEMTLPDGEVLRGRTDSSGFIRRDALRQPGECTIRFPSVDTP